MVGDASKAKEELGWNPRTSFKELVRLMVDYDYKSLKPNDSDMNKNSNIYIAGHTATWSDHLFIEN